MKTITLTFYECEHEGDLDNYADDVRECGGKVIDSEINEDAEIGRLTVQVEDKATFLAKFKETDAAQFLN